MKEVLYKATGAVLILLGTFLVVFYGFMAYTQMRIIPLIASIVLFSIFLFHEWYYFHVGHGNFPESRLSSSSLVLTLISIAFLVIPTIFMFNAPIEYLTLYGIFVFVSIISYVVAIGLLIISWYSQASCISCRVCR